MGRITAKKVKKVIKEFVFQEKYGIFVTPRQVCY